MADLFGFGKGIAAETTAQQERQLQQSQDNLRALAPAANRRGGALATALGQRAATQRRIKQEENQGQEFMTHLDRVIGDTDGPVNLAQARIEATVRYAAQAKAEGRHALARQLYDTASQMQEARQVHNAAIRQTTAQATSSEALTAGRQQENRANDQLFVMDARTGERIARIQNTETLEEDAQAAAGDRDFYVVGLQDYIDIVGHEAADSDMAEILSANDFRMTREVLTNGTTFSNLANDLTSILTESLEAGQDALSDVSGMEVIAGRLARDASEVQSRFQGASFQDVDKQTTREVQDMAQSWMQENAERAARRGITSSTMTQMTYMLALLYNQRVTDKDFDVAYSMLGGDQGDSRSALNNLRHLVQRSGTGVDTAFSPLDTEAVGRTGRGQVLRRAYGDNRAARERTLSTIDAAIERFGGPDVGQGPAGPAAPEPESDFIFVDQE